MSQYDAFAEDFARTRSRPWEFLVAITHELTGLGLLKLYDLGVDIGCGIGQNSTLFLQNSHIRIGLDLSLELLCKTKKKYSDLIQADLQAMPFRGETFDFALCVAVLHHILGRESRQQAINEIGRIMNARGNLFLTVWRRWQDKYRKFFLHEGFHNASQYFPAGWKDFGDVELGWGDPKHRINYPRSYHLFTRSELRNLLNIFQVLFFKLTGHKNSRTNYVAFLQKV